MSNARGGTWLDASRRWLAAHPRVALATKAAVAAALAWLVALPLPGLADDYPYYAPFGAVIAVSTTVAGSMRESAQGIAAMLLGAALAISLRPLPLAEVVAIAGVVAIGTLLAGWPRLGPNGSWVPVSAMFVLIIGQQDPGGYALAYVGLTALGATIGVGVNLLVPPLPLTPTQHSVTALRETLADQLDELAEGLLSEEPPDRDQWEERRMEITPLTSEMRSMVEHAREARRANWRARRWRHEADRQYEQARALEQLAFLVEDVTELLVDVERAGRDHMALGSSLRPYAAHALQETAEALRSVHGSCAEPEPAADADEAVSRLAEEIRATRTRTGADMLEAATLVTSLQRALLSLMPAEVDSKVEQAW
jgi:uncharacterized membrane protein YgaE (UPF0421/DUF939 family)